MSGMIYVDFFSGIGGVSLAADLAGFTVAAHCETDPFCRRVLLKHWPDAPCFGDIHDVTARTLRDAGIARIDLAHFSPPCQSLSVAGKQRGANDPRYLWPAVVRLLADLGDCELKPAGVLIENVAGALVVVDAWLTDLDRLGYDAAPITLPAAAVGAPHLRNRLFIVGFARGELVCGEGRDISGDVGASASGADRPGKGAIRNTAPCAGSGTLADPISLESQRGGAAGDVASTPRGDEGEAQQRKRFRDTAGGCREVVADAYGERLAEWGERDSHPLTGLEPSHGDDVGGCAALVADSLGEGSEARGRQERRGQSTAEQPRRGCSASDLSDVESGVGGILDEFSGALAGRGLTWHGWPALPGQPQHEHEHPRTTGKEPLRRQKLQALGNAVCVAQVYPILCAMYAALTRSAEEETA